MRWPGRSKPVRPQTSSSRPTSTGSTISTSAICCAPGTRIDLLRNRLVLIAPAQARASLPIAPGFALAAALGTSKLAMANPDSVPAGKYGKAALTALGVWASVESRIARDDNVRAALVLVARGEAPLRHRLHDRRARRTQGAHRRYISRGDAPADRLSGRDRRNEPLASRADASSTTCASPGRASDLAAPRLRDGELAGIVPSDDRIRHHRAEPEGRVRRRCVQPAAGDLLRLRARAHRFSRQDAARCARPPAAGAAAGRRRIRAAAALRQARAARRMARRLVRHRVRVSLDRRRARGRDHGLSADGARDTPVDRRDRPPPRNRRAHARRIARLGVRVDHAAAGAAGHRHRRAAVVRARASASSARRSRSCPTFPARPKRCRSRSTRSRRCPAAMPRRCACRSSPWFCRSRR